MNTFILFPLLLFASHIAGALSRSVNKRSVNLFGILAVYTLEEGVRVGCLNSTGGYQSNFDATCTVFQVLETAISTHCIFSKDEGACGYMTPTDLPDLVSNTVRSSDSGIFVCGENHDLDVYHELGFSQDQPSIKQLQVEVPGNKKQAFNVETGIATDPEHGLFFIEEPRFVEMLASAASTSAALSIAASSTAASSTPESSPPESSPKKTPPPEPSPKKSPAASSTAASSTATSTTKSSTTTLSPATPA